MTDPQHVHSTITPDQRRALTAARDRNLNPTERIPDPDDEDRTTRKWSGSTIAALTRKRLIEPIAGTPYYQQTEWAHTVLNTPLPHEPYLLAQTGPTNDADQFTDEHGYTTKFYLAVPDEPEAVHVEQLNPSWANDATRRHKAQQDRYDRARALRRAA